MKQLVVILLIFLIVSCKSSKFVSIEYDEQYLLSNFLKTDFNRIYNQVDKIPISYLKYINRDRHRAYPIQFANPREYYNSSCLVAKHDINGQLISYGRGENQIEFLFYHLGMGYFGSQKFCDIFKRISKKEYIRKSFLLEPDIKNIKDIKEFISKKVNQ